MLVLCTLIALLFPLPASAAPVTYHRAGGGGAGDAALTPTPTGSASVATIPHGDALGAWTFVPGSSTLHPGTPRTTTGPGWATAPMTGRIPAGRWILGATVSTDAPAGSLTGQVTATILARSSTGASRRLGVATSAAPVLSTPGPQSLSLTADLGDVVLRDESIITVFSLLIGRADEPGAWSTTLTSGTAGDTVSVPGVAAVLPLWPPTRAAVSDTEDGRVTVTWAPSQDARVTGYVVQTASAATGPYADRVGPVTTSSAVVDSLTNDTPVYVRVIGVTADGTRTPPSNLTAGRSRDRTAPDAPTGLTVANDGSGRVQLAWSSSTATDLVGYVVERAPASTGPFRAVGPVVTATSYTDLDAPAHSTWHYRVRAVDDDGLRSAPTATSAVTALPATPTGIEVTSVGDGSVSLAWTRASTQVAGYRVERAVGNGAFTFLTGVTGTTLTDTGLTNATTYRYRVVALDSTGARSSPSASVSGTPVATPVPVAPPWLEATVSGSDVVLQWARSPSTGIVGYRVLRSIDGAPPTVVGGLRPDLTFTDRGLVLGRSYTYAVVAEDAKGQQSAPSTGVEVGLRPAAPTGLAAQTIGSATVDLTWSATDDPGATYEVWRSGVDDTVAALVGRTSTTTYQDGGLALETTYRYFVRAVSVNGRASTASAIVSATLRDGPPSAPIVTVADTTEGGSVEVRWQAPVETDVVSWRVERRPAGDSRWTVVTDAPQPLRGHRDGDLVDGERYEYRVIAVDRAGQESPPSTIATVIPTDTTPPSAPAAPIVRASVGGLEVDWSVTEDAVRYEVRRDDGAGGPLRPVATTSLRSYRDTEVVRGRTYRYEVVAYDAAGNASPPSPPVSASYAAVAPAGGLPVLPVGGDPFAPGTPGAPTEPGTPGSPGEPATPGSGDPLDPDLFAPGGRPPIAAPDPVDPAVFDPPRPGTAGAPDGNGPIVALEDPSSGLADAARDLAAGNVAGAVGRVVGEVASSVPDAARAFSIPLVVLLLMLLYLLVQGRIDRDASLLIVEAPTGGDDDDREFLL